MYFGPFERELGPSVFMITTILSSIQGLWAHQQLCWTISEDAGPINNLGVIYKLDLQDLVMESSTLGQCNDLIGVYGRDLLR